MRASQTTRSRANGWWVDPGFAGALTRKLRATKTNEDRMSSMRAIIVSSLFLMGLASAMLFGGHAALDPLLQSAIAARHPTGLGDVVYTMPDRVYCRHLSFDNVTGDIAESSIGFCSEEIAKEEHARSGRGFAWGN
jgi:hypothetical protein